MDSEVQCVALQLEYRVFQSTSYNLFFQIFRKIISHYICFPVSVLKDNPNKYIFALIILIYETKGFF